jgi:hypothetical protein
MLGLIGAFNPQEFLKMGAQREKRRAGPDQDAPGRSPERIRDPIESSFVGAKKKGAEFSY